MNSKDQPRRRGKGAKKRVLLQEKRLAEEKNEIDGEKQEVLTGGPRKKFTSTIPEKESVSPVEKVKIAVNEDTWVTPRECECVQNCGCKRLLVCECKGRCTCKCIGCSCKKSGNVCSCRMKLSCRAPFYENNPPVCKKHIIVS